MDDETNDQIKNKYDDSSKLTGQDLRASSLGWEIAIPIVGGAILGNYLDRKFDSGIYLTMILLVLGIMAAAYFVIRYIYAERALLEEDEDDDEEEDFYFH
jgi:F0F1-type ATP synthase assembly protein I